MDYNNLVGGDMQQIMGEPKNIETVYNKLLKIERDISNLLEPPVSDDFGKAELQPRKGAIAFCSLNRLGLITSETQIEVTYNDGNKGMSWVGIQLTDGEVNGVGGDKGKIIKQKAGDTWMARKPKVIAYIDDIISQNSR